jgi:hypothetical protein
VIGSRKQMRYKNSSFIIYGLTNLDVYILYLVCN